MEYPPSIELRRRWYKGQCKGVRNDLVDMYMEMHPGTTVFPEELEALGPLQRKQAQAGGRRRGGNNARLADFAERSGYLHAVGELPPSLKVLREWMKANGVGDRMPRKCPRMRFALEKRWGNTPAQCMKTKARRARRKKSKPDAPSAPPPPPGVARKLKKKISRPSFTPCRNLRSVNSLQKRWQAGTCEEGFTLKDYLAAVARAGNASARRPEPGFGAPTRQQEWATDYGVARLTKARNATSRRERLDEALDARPKEWMLLANQKRPPRAGSRRLVLDEDEFDDPDSMRANKKTKLRAWRDLIDENNASGYNLEDVLAEARKSGLRAWQANKQEAAKTPVAAVAVAGEIAKLENDIAMAKLSLKDRKRELRPYQRKEKQFEKKKRQLKEVLFKRGKAYWDDEDGPYDPETYGEYEWSEYYPWPNIIERHIGHSLNRTVNRLKRRQKDERYQYEGRKRDVHRAQVKVDIAVDALTDAKRRAGMDWEWRPGSGRAPTFGDLSQYPDIMDTIMKKMDNVTAIRFGATNRKNRLATSKVLMDNFVAAYERAKERAKSK
eukprot:jgi/Mesvir1/21630/Mv04052-RA.1